MSGWECPECGSVACKGHQVADRPQPLSEEELAEADLHTARQALEQAQEVIGILYDIETILVRRGVCGMLESHPEQGHGGGADTADLLEAELNRLRAKGKYWQVVTAALVALAPARTGGAAMRLTAEERDAIWKRYRGGGFLRPPGVSDIERLCDALDASEVARGALRLSLRQVRDALKEVKQSNGTYGLGLPLLEYIEHEIRSIDAALAKDKEFGG